MCGISRESRQHVNYHPIIPGIVDRLLHRTPAYDMHLLKRGEEDPLARAHHERPPVRLRLSTQAPSSSVWIESSLDCVPSTPHGILQRRYQRAVLKCPLGVAHEPTVRQACPRTAARRGRSGGGAQQAYLPEHCRQRRRPPGQRRNGSGQRSNPPALSRAEAGAAEVRGPSQLLQPLRQCYARRSRTGFEAGRTFPDEWSVEDRKRGQ